MKEFVVLLRHDLDGLSFKELKELLNFERKKRVRSTLFVLLSQLSKSDFNLAIKKAADGGWDIQLHSEGKMPRNFFLRQFMKLFLYLRIRCLVSALYVYNLKRQYEFFNKAGFNPEGHAPHAQNCYLFGNIDQDWVLIRKASLRSGFLWLSDYTSILKTPYGENFVRPSDAMLIEKQKNMNFLILPTSWDDRFTFKFKRKVFSWVNEPAEKKPFGEIKKSILNQLKYCGRKNIPFIINLHPIHFLGLKKQYGLEVESWLIKFCRKQKIPIMTIKDYYARIAKEKNKGLSS